MLAKPAPTAVTTYELKRVDGTLLRALAPKQIRAMAMAGELYTDDMICRTGESNWRSAATLAELPVRKREVVKPVAVVAAVDPRIAEAQEHARQLQDALNELEQTCAALRVGQRESQEALNGARAEVESANSQAEASQSELEHLRSLSESTRRELAQSQLERAALDGTVATLESTIHSLQQSNESLQQACAELRLQPPSAQVVHELEAAQRERAVAEQHAREAIEDRDELITSLSHSQDALRTADDLRRALEKSIATTKQQASEQAGEAVQLRAALVESKTAIAALTLRAESAESLAQDAQRVKAEAAAWVARTTEQRDAALKSRDSALGDRDAALSERDSTRLAVGATQTDLVRVRRDYESVQGEFASACTALSEMTSRAAALESAIAEARSQQCDLVGQRDARDEQIEVLRQNESRLRVTIDEVARHRDDLQVQAASSAACAADWATERDQARAEVASLHQDLASLREQNASTIQRHAALERELAEERSRIVARDELIFRESLRSEERETDNRKLTAALAGLRADCDAQVRRADDALAQVLVAQRDLASAQHLAAEQAAQVTATQDELENLTLMEHSARAALTAASRERDEVAAALATAQAAVSSREQQVSAERQLRDQAEASSRQLLASYEKLADDTGRRITDLEVKLSDSNRDIQTIREREEHASVALAEAHAHARTLAQKLAAVEEQRTAVTRDRDSHAKRAATEASARAAAEDKISVANERAAKAERDARLTSERSLQAALIALSGSKQRLDSDYAQSRAELEVLEQLVAESSRQLIAAGGTVPGVPLLPREAAAKAAADAKAASEAAVLLAAHVQSQTHVASAVRTEPQRSAPVPAPPQLSFRMVESDSDDHAHSRAPVSRTLGTTGASARAGGQRERVSQPRAQSTSSSNDDDSSSPSAPARPHPPPPTSRPAPPRTPPQPAIDDGWTDDQLAVHCIEPAPRAVGVIAVTALVVACTAALSAIPHFAALDLRSAFVQISAWVVAAPAVVALAHLITSRCEPILARRVSALSSTVVALAPLSSLAFAHAPWLGALLTLGCAALPWLMCYAAWPDARLLVGLHGARSVARHAAATDRFATRARYASAASVVLAAVALTALATPWDAAHGVMLLSLPGALVALALAATIALTLTPSIRHRAPLAAWIALALIVALIAAPLSVQGVTMGVAATSLSAWFALAAAWSAVAASSLATACSSEQIARSAVRSLEDDTPALVAHERIHASWVMALTALIPVLPALVAFHLVRGRSRRAESQLRSLANFELWFAAISTIALLATIIFYGHIGSSLLVGLFLAHAALCGGCSITMSTDRFVRFPSPMPLVARPDGGLDLPIPLVTVQRTVDHSPHRPIVHPCGTTAWGCATVLLGTLALAAATRDLALTLALGPIVGLALWLPSLIASRCRHQDTLLLCTIATAFPVLLVLASFFLETATNPAGIPTLVALAGAGAGIWALLVGWAFKGMSQLAGLVRAGAQQRLDASGELIAPVDHPSSRARRDRIMRHVVIGTCGAAAVSALIMVLAPTTRDESSPVLVCGIISLALSGTLWFIASIGDRERLVRSAALFASLLAVSSLFGALPFFFRTAEVGALDALRDLAFAFTTALCALLAAGVLNTLREPHAQRAERSLLSPSRLRAPTPVARSRTTRKVPT